MRGLLKIFELLKLTGILIDSIGLSVILGHFMMDETHNIRTNGCLKHGWEADWSLGGFILLRIDGDQRTTSSKTLWTKNKF